MLSTPRFNIDKFNNIIQKCMCVQHEMTKKKRKRQQDTDMYVSNADIESCEDIKTLLREQMCKQEYYV